MDRGLPPLPRRQEFFPSCRNSPLACPWFFSNSCFPFAVKSSSHSQLMNFQKEKWVPIFVFVRFFDTICPFSLCNLVAIHRVILVFPPRFHPLRVQFPTEVANPVLMIRPVFPRTLSHFSYRPDSPPQLPDVLCRPFFTFRMGDVFWISSLNLSLLQKLLLASRSLWVKERGQPAACYRWLSASPCKSISDFLLVFLLCILPLICLANFLQGSTNFAALKPLPNLREFPPPIAVIGFLYRTFPFSSIFSGACFFSPCTIA